MAGGHRWALTLCVDGASTSSIHAIETAHHVCDEEFGDDVELEVIDVHQQPTLAERDQIVAVPNLVRRFPGPPRRIVGDLSSAAWIRHGLGPAEGSDRQPDLSE